jgi:hypothetical protein
MSSEQPQDTCIDCQPVSRNEEHAFSGPSASMKSEEGLAISGAPEAATSNAVQEDVMNPATFPLPNLAKEVHVVIEYCNRW